METLAPPALIPAEEWRSKARAHFERAHRWTATARANRAAGRPNPIEDFLSVYYPFTFAKVEQWHPPYGTALEVDEPIEPLPDRFRRLPYQETGGVVFQNASGLTEKQRNRLRWTRELLIATRDRAPNFACHGLHEWAMVYRGQDIRHEKTAPLRLPQQDIDALVESRPIVCSHFDAFRFFAPEAIPFNRQQPTMLGRQDFEQPGCVHANMDLYKWASKSMPWVGSDLLIDCYEMARKLRDLDMRASPYDLRAWGYEPVRIETPEGRRIYEREQRDLADQSSHLRARLIAALEFVG
jgi:hypothetical protein